MEATAKSVDLLARVWVWPFLKSENVQKNSIAPSQVPVHVFLCPLRGWSCTTRALSVPISRQKEWGLLAWPLLPRLPPAHCLLCTHRLCPCPARGSAHIAPLQLIKTKSKHLLLALSAFLPVCNGCQLGTPNSVLLPPAWEGLAAGGLPLLLWGRPGVHKGPSSAAVGVLGRPVQSQGASAHTWVLLCWEKKKKKTAGEGVEGLGVLIAFALHVAEDKCHQADSLDLHHGHLCCVVSTE